MHRDSVRGQDVSVSATLRPAFSSIIWSSRGNRKNDSGTSKPFDHGTAMTVAYDNEEIAEYFLLIKKLTNRKIHSPDHKFIKDDIVQDVFLKLYKSDFFSANQFGVSEENDKKIASYIYRTISSCYIDHLKSQGLTRRLPKPEADESGYRYQSISTQDIQDVEEETMLQTAVSADQYVSLQEAYRWIRECFYSVLSATKDASKQAFFEAVFWELDKYTMTIKELAKCLGYDSSNPTQELNRFVTKVNLCTNPHGVYIDNPREQILFLSEQILNVEAN